MSLDFSGDVRTTALQHLRDVYLGTTLVTESRSLRRTKEFPCSRVGALLRRETMHRPKALIWGIGAGKSSELTAIELADHSIM